MDEADERTKEPVGGEWIAGKVRDFVAVTDDAFGNGRVSISGP